jgi:hypothetical protein
MVAAALPAMLRKKLALPKLIALALDELSALAKPAMLANEKSIGQRQHC